jgi:hypothetical protein
MSNAALTRVFEILAMIFALLTAVRMFRCGLHRRYPCLFAYLVFLVAYNIGPVTMNLASRAYFWVWVISEPVLWTFEILVVRELCGLMLERYKGLSTLGRWAIYGAVVLSSAVSVASLIPRMPNALTRRSALLTYLYGCDRGINLALGIFLLLMLLFVRRYPVPLNRNVVLNTALFTAQFFSTTLAVLLRTVFDLRLGHTLDVGLCVLDLASLIIWCFVLTPAGEQQHVELMHFRPGTESRILERLDQINRLMLRVAELA